MKLKKFIIFYILLLIFHFAHFIEEALGNASFIESIYRGLANFLVASIILFLIPVVLLYLVMNKNKIAYSLSYIYAGIMVIDGIGHLASLSLNKESLLISSAGAYTGIGLIIFGVLLILALRKGK